MSTFNQNRAIILSTDGKNQNPEIVGFGERYDMRLYKGWCTEIGTYSAEENAARVHHAYDRVDILDKQTNEAVLLGFDSVTKSLLCVETHEDIPYLFSKEHERLLSEAGKTHTQATTFRPETMTCWKRFNFDAVKEAQGAYWDCTDAHLVARSVKEVAKERICWRYTEYDKDDKQIFQNHSRDTDQLSYYWWDDHPGYAEEIAEYYPIFDETTFMAKFVQTLQTAQRLDEICTPEVAETVLGYFKHATRSTARPTPQGPKLIVL